MVREIGAGALVLSAGMGAAAAGLWLGTQPQPSPTQWLGHPVFWAIWTVLYPCVGVATGQVWQQPDTDRRTTALVLSGLNLLVLLAFVPIAAVADDVRATALLDVVGLGAGYAMAWAFRRAHPAALRWLLPYLIWLPITTMLKLALWAGIV